MSNTQNAKMHCTGISASNCSVQYKGQRKFSLHVALDVTMRNSFIIKEGVSKRADKNISFRQRAPPPLHCSKGGWFSGADSAGASAFSFPLHSDSLQLCFVLGLEVTRRPVTPRPPWDLSIHTCSDAQGKHRPFHFMILAHPTHTPFPSVSSPSVLITYAYLSTDK